MSMNTNTTPLVLYHAGCFDGFCSAWICRKAMPDAECVPVYYGQEPPDVAGRRVWIVDFSYKRPVLLEMAKKAESLYVLDHHKTAKEELWGEGIFWDANTFIKFDLDKSGGRLAWEHFFPGKTAPWLVDYTEDRDLWRHALPKSREANAALRSYPMDFETWDDFAGWPGYGTNYAAKLDIWLASLQYGWRRSDYPDEIAVCKDGLNQLASEGGALLRYQKQVVDQHVRYAVETEIAGHRVPAVNATTLFSEIAGELAKGKPFGVAWFMRQDGKIQWSLRSAPDGVDVSEVAKLFGGGGHARASGFETESCPL